LSNGHAANKSTNNKIFTIFDEIFSFQFRSRITCATCGRLSDTIENTNTWPVDVKVRFGLIKIKILKFNFEKILSTCKTFEKACCISCVKKSSRARTPINAIGIISY
jgi:ubiquitin C-terminal hydrolase